MRRLKVKYIEMQVFGANVKKGREHLHMLPTELAEACCIGVDYLSDIEKGHVSFSTTTVVLLARALRVNVGDLFVADVQYKTTEIIDLTLMRRMSVAADGMHELSRTIDRLLHAYVAGERASGAGN